MREKLEKVPEGNWMCEECMLEDENKRQKKNNFEKEEASRSEKSSLNEMIKNSKNSGALSCKINLESNTKGIGGVYKNRRSDSSSCHFPAKRQVDDSEAFTVKRMALEKGHSSSMLSKESYPFSKAEICQGSSLIKPFYKGISFGNNSYFSLEFLQVATVKLINHFMLSYYCNLRMKLC